METWDCTCKSSTSTCKGVLESSRKIWVSVSILVGIKLRRRIFKGRISCRLARSFVITKMFSSSKLCRAGNWSSILIGMAFTSSFFAVIISELVSEIKV